MYKKYRIFDSKYAITLSTANNAHIKNITKLYSTMTPLLWPPLPPLPLPNWGPLT